MKKLFIFAAALALTFTSCGNKSQNNAANADSTEVTGNETGNADDAEATAEMSEESKATVENLTGELQKAVENKDQKATISTLANLQTIYKNLVEQGKLDEAKAYGSAIKKFVSENSESLKNLASGNTTVESLVNGIVNLPTSAAATADQAKAAIASDVVSLASPVIAKGETAVSTAKAAAEMVKNAPASVKNAAENVAKNAINDAENTAKEKANEAVSNAANNANEKAAEAKQKVADKVNEGKQKANDAVNKAANKALNQLLK